MAYDPLNRRMSRRNFLSYAGRLAAGGAATFVLGSSLGIVLSACSPVKRIYTIQDVRAGLVEPSVYVAQMSSSMSEVQDAKSNGILKDVLYDPTEEKIRQITIETMTDKGDNRSVIQSSADVAIDAYLTSKNKHKSTATVLPGTSLLFGAHMPMYMAFFEGFAGNTETDEEFRMVVRHEMRHIEDFYGGITLGSFHVTGITPGVNSEFIDNLGELRATHDTSMKIYQEFKISGRLPVTPDYFGNEMDHYASYWKLVKTGGTATEKMLADLQLAEFSDIVPEELNNGTVKVTFTLQGEKESLIVKRVK